MKKVVCQRLDKTMFEKVLLGIRSMFTRMMGALSIVIEIFIILAWMSYK